MPDSSVVRELEASNPRAPELDAEAPAPQSLEMETVKSSSQHELGIQININKYVFGIIKVRYFKLIIIVNRI